MEELVLYHGSQRIVERPEQGHGRAGRDFGPGFYCTMQRELALEWACGDGRDGFVSRYHLDPQGLVLADLSGEPYHLLQWAALVASNRVMGLACARDKERRDYLIETFLPDLESADLILGPRADDSTFSFLRAFLMNQISFGQLRDAMDALQPARQVCLRTPRALKAAHYLYYSAADSAFYYPKRRLRDAKVRAAFLNCLEAKDPEGVCLDEIMEEKMEVGHVRLQ